MGGIPATGGGDGQTDLVLEYRAPSIGFIALWYSNELHDIHDPGTEAEFSTYWEEEVTDPPPPKPPKYEVGETTYEYPGSDTHKGQDYGGINWFNEDLDIYLSHSDDEKYPYEVPYTYYSNTKAFSYGEATIQTPGFIYGIAVWEHIDEETQESKLWVIAICEKEKRGSSASAKLAVYAYPFLGNGTSYTKYPTTANVGADNWLELLEIDLNAGATSADSYTYFNFNQAGDKAVAILSPLANNTTVGMQVSISWDDAQISPQPQAVLDPPLRIEPGCVHTLTSPDYYSSVDTYTGSYLVAADYRFLPIKEEDLEEGEVLGDLQNEETVVYAYVVLDSTETSGCFSDEPSNPCKIDGTTINYKTTGGGDSESVVLGPTHGFYIDGIEVGGVPKQFQLNNFVAYNYTMSGSCDKVYTGDCNYNNNEKECSTSASGSKAFLDAGPYVIDLKNGFVVYGTHITENVYTGASTTGEYPQVTYESFVTNTLMLYTPSGKEISLLDNDLLEHHWLEDTGTSSTGRSCNGSNTESTTEFRSLFGTPTHWVAKRDAVTPKGAIIFYALTADENGSIEINRIVDPHDNILDPYELAEFDKQDPPPDPYPTAETGYFLDIGLIQA